MDNSVKMEKTVKITFVTLILLHCYKSSFVLGLQESVGENQTVHLRCRHGVNPGIDTINRIMWATNAKHPADPTRTTPIASITSGGTLVNVAASLVDRVGISYPEGTLTIENVSRSDANNYTCILLVNSARRDTNIWIDLDVLVPPKMLMIKCSASNTGQPDEDCSAIKEDKITAIQCNAASNPVSSTVWTPPKDCRVNVTTMQPKMLDNGLMLSGSVVRNLCAGEYCCHYNYHAGGIFGNGKVCQMVGGAAADDTTASPLTSQANWRLYVIIGGVIFVILLLLICCCCWWHKRKNNPDICKLPLHNTQKKTPVVVEIINEDGNETTALTPFLGPNHVQPGQPVFSFVVNEANDDPNVDRVKVTQDIEPGGEKSRMVEIFKKKDALLQPDFQVPPGIFRRALSNSDVSKIVYKETVDETGRTKRELDIIKAEDEEIEVEPILRAAGSTMSYHRQLSIRPSTSEGDVRKVRFQRQDTIDTIDSGSDETDGFVYLPRASEVNRRQMKYQQSVSVDIDDVD